MDKIYEGRHVVLRRGLSDRVITFSAQKSVHYGKGSSHVEIDLANAQDCLIYSSFNIEKQGKKYILARNAEFQAGTAFEGPQKCGTDNRNIMDVNNKSAEEIMKMKEEGKSGREILESLVSSSKNFEMKTEYSQQKYLKKKMLHYSDSIHFLPVDFPFLCQHYGTMRVEAVAQMLSYGNVHANGNYIVYETGMSGVLVAAVMKRLGGLGNCVHVHVGSCPQRQAVNYMDFPSLHVLRSLDVFYLDRLTQEMKTEDEGPGCKKPKLEVNLGTTNRQMNEESLRFLKDNQINGILMAGKEHPLSLLQKLLRFHSPSSPLVIYCQYVEPLVECYEYLKEKNAAINIQIVDNFYRVMQIEVDRTHPEITMTSGGYILHAILVLS